MEKQENDNDSDMGSTPESIKTAANEIANSLLHQKSKDRYMKAYDNFINWRNKKRVQSWSESVFLTYFSELSKKLKPSSLWSIYSMLNSTIHTKHNVDLKQFSKITLLLKRLSDGFTCKKSKVLSAKDIETFLNEAPDNKYLAIKVALIFGVSGACRSSELLNITIDNIERHNQMLLIKNTESKNDCHFVIRDEFINIVEKYMALRPSSTNTNRFFLNYQNGKCFNIPIGKNKFGKFPYEIASFLNLENPKAYTGHCFRRTSATLRAGSRADLTTVKSNDAKKSDQEAEGYIEESVHLHQSTSTSPCPSPSYDNDSKSGLHLSESSDSDANHHFSEINLNNTKINVPGKRANFTFINCTFSNCKFS